MGFKILTLIILKYAAFEELFRFVFSYVIIFIASISISSQVGLLKILSC